MMTIHAVMLTSVLAKVFVRTPLYVKTRLAATNVLVFLVMQVLHNLPVTVLILTNVLLLTASITLIARIQTGASYATAIKAINVSMSPA